MVSISGDISDGQYRQLMEWVFNKSDAVMLVFRCFDKEYWRKMKLIRSDLAPYRILTRNAPLRWPGTELLGDPKGHPPLHIDIYRLSPRIRDFILEVNHLNGWNYPDLPEDIAFFSKGLCWFSTTIHEELYTLLGNDREYKVQLETFGIPYQWSLKCGEDFREQYSV